MSYQKTIVVEAANAARQSAMSSEERLQATIAFKPVDRLVCGPFVYGYAASFAGITQARFINDFDLAQLCMDKLKAAYPIWDLYRSSFADLGYGPTLRQRWFQKVALPGDELPEDAPYQILEGVLATQEELRAIKTQGLQKYMIAVTKRIRPNKGLIHFLLWESRRNKLHKRDVAAAHKRGQAFHYGGTYAPPFELLSMTRSMVEFNKDMYRLKDELVEVMWAMQKESIEMAVKSCKGSGVPRVFVVGCRCGTTILNKKNFETYSWPFIKDGALKLIERGITPIFHLDTDWGRALEYFLQLPKHKCIIETDGATDLFKARDILKDHMVLSGDVPASLLTVASASEVEEYSRKLILAMAKTGGYIFSNGCTMPSNSRHENVRAMFETVERCGRYD
jgi:uroporphyrinogen decarboxylase